MYQTMVAIAKPPEMNLLATLATTLIARFTQVSPETSSKMVKFQLWCDELPEQDPDTIDWVYGRLLTTSGGPYYPGIILKNPPESYLQDYLSPAMIRKNFDAVVKSLFRPNVNDVTFSSCLEIMLSSNTRRPTQALVRESIKQHVNFQAMSAIQTKLLFHYMPNEAFVKQKFRHFTRNGGLGDDDAWRRTVILFQHTCNNAITGSLPHDYFVSLFILSDALFTEQGQLPPKKLIGPASVEWLYAIHKHDPSMFQESLIHLFLDNEHEFHMSVNSRMIEFLLKVNPLNATCPSPVTAQLPLHIMLERNIRVPRMLMESSPEQLSQKCRQSDLYPFMIPASRAQFDLWNRKLTETFELLRQSPGLIAPAVEDCPPYMDDPKYIELCKGKMLKARLERVGKKMSYKFELRLKQRKERRQRMPLQLA